MQIFQHGKRSNMICAMMDKHVLFNETLFELKKQLEDAAELKMKNGGVDTNMVR